MTEETHDCSQCSQVVAFDQIHETTEDGKVCDRCRDDYVALENGDVIHREDAAFCEYSEEWHYAHETNVCGECDRTIFVAYGGTTNRQYFVCDDCLGDTYVLPEDAASSRDWYHIEDVYYCDRTEGVYADECNMPSNSELLPYDANVFNHCLPRKWLKGKAIHANRCGNDLLFGVELEYDCDDPNYAAERLFDAGFDNDVGILKEDSTVTGGEMVTLPADLESHKSGFQWEAWCRALRHVDCQGHNASDAGIHVHINRQALSQLTLGKMLVFMNAPENMDFLSCIAQRDIKYCGWCTPKHAQFDKVGKAAMEPCSGKYSMLNVTRYTVENRMFNSNLRAERVLKNVEFCHALVMFARNTSARTLTHAKFQEYVAAERKTYPNLHRFINDKWQCEIVHSVAA